MLTFKKIVIFKGLSQKNNNDCITSMLPFAYFLLFANLIGNFSLWKSVKFFGVWNLNFGEFLEITFKKNFWNYRKARITSDIIKCYHHQTKTLEKVEIQHFKVSNKQNANKIKNVIKMKKSRSFLAPTFIWRTIKFQKTGKFTNFLFFSNID